jgi:hypothetical protein
VEFSRIGKGLVNWNVGNHLSKLEGNVMHIQLDIFPQQQEFYNPQFVSIFFYLSTPKSTSIKGLGSCL